MIKKLSLLTILCFMRIISADELSDAIRFSDAQRVSALLSRTTLTEKQLNKYLDLAEHVITARREQLKDDIILTDYSWSKATNKWGCAMMISFAGMLVSGIMCARGDSYEHIYGGITITSLGSTIVSGLVLAICMDNDRRTWYANALRIKELLHDYEVSTIE